MGVDTKGFVVTRSKDVLKVSALANHALDAIISQDRKEKFGNVPAFNAEAREQYSSVDCRLIPDSGMVQFTFKFRGVQRMLSMFFTCDGDHADYGPRTISMSMGCSGYSDVFVQVVLHALSILGTAYYDYNDCDDVDAAVLEVKKPNLLQAIALKYLKSYDLDDWVEYFKDSGVITGATKAAFEEFFGDAQRKYSDILKIEKYSDRMDALDNLAAAQPVIERPFMSALQEEVATT